MSANEPTQVIEVFAKLFNSGDMDGLMDTLYEDDVVLVPGPGAEVAKGKDAARAVLQEFLNLGGTITIEAAAAYEMGDIALTHSKWKLDVPGADAMTGTTAEIVRRQPDGSWKYVVDNPWGGAVLS